MTLLQTLILYLATTTAVSLLTLAAFLWLISKQTPIIKARAAIAKALGEQK